MRKKISVLYYGNMFHNVLSHPDSYVPWFLKKMFSSIRLPQLKSWSPGEYLEKKIIRLAQIEKKLLHFEIRKIPINIKRDSSIFSSKTQETHGNFWVNRRKSVYFRLSSALFKDLNDPNLKQNQFRKYKITFDVRTDKSTFLNNKDNSLTFGESGNSNPVMAVPISKRKIIRMT